MISPERQGISRGNRCTEGVKMAVTSTPRRLVAPTVAPGKTCRSHQRGGAHI
jgi:hypothetical protein